MLGLARLIKSHPRVNMAPLLWVDATEVIDELRRIGCHASRRIEKWHQWRDGMLTRLIGQRLKLA